MPQIEFIVPVTAARGPWPEMQGEPLDRVRRSLNHQVSTSFPTEMRALIDHEIVEKANTVIQYLNRWDETEPPIVVFPGADPTNARLQNFKATAGSLVLFVKLTTRQTGRSDSRTRVAEHARMHEWCTSWLVRRPSDIAGMLMEHYANYYREDLGTREELHAAIATWRAAEPDEQHAAVLLAWLISARELADLALVVLVAEDVLKHYCRTVAEARDVLEEVLALLRYCDVPDEPESQDSDDSDTFFYPPPFGSEDR